MTDDGTITISTYKKEGGCQIEIEDQGIGIEEPNYIFKPFYKDLPIFPILSNLPSTGLI